jgi:hypothetical protein
MSARGLIALCPSCGGSASPGERAPRQQLTVNYPVRLDPSALDPSTSSVARGVRMSCDPTPVLPTFLASPAFGGHAGPPRLWTYEQAAHPATCVAWKTPANGSHRRVPAARLDVVEGRQMAHLPRSGCRVYGVKLSQPQRDNTASSGGNFPGGYFTALTAATGWPNDPTGGSGGSGAPPGKPALTGLRR